MNGHGRVPLAGEPQRKGQPSATPPNGMGVLAAVLFILACGIGAAVILMNSTSLR